MLQRQSSVAPPLARQMSRQKDPGQPVVVPPIIDFITDGPAEADDQAAEALLHHQLRKGTIKAIRIVTGASNVPPKDEQLEYWRDKLADDPKLELTTIEEAKPLVGTASQPVIRLFLSPMQTEDPPEAVCERLGIQLSPHDTLFIQGEPQAYNQTESNKPWQDWLTEAAESPYCAVLCSKDSRHRPCPLLHQKMEQAGHAWAVNRHLQFSVIALLSSPSQEEAPNHWWRLLLRDGGDGPNLVQIKALSSLLCCEPKEPTELDKEQARAAAEAYVADCADRALVVDKMTELILLRWDLVRSVGISLVGEEHKVMVDAHRKGPPSPRWKLAVDRLAPHLKDLSGGIDAEAPLSYLSPLYDMAAAAAAVDLAEWPGRTDLGMAAIRQKASQGHYLEPLPMLAKFE